MTAPRWQDCISHGDAEAEEFIQEYFSRAECHTLLIAGAGFDPRSATIAEMLASSIEAERLKAIFLREQRPNPGVDLLRAGDKNAAALTSRIHDSRILDVEVLSETDSAVVVGQRAISAIRALGPRLLEGITDVVLDISALSIGIAFPTASYFMKVCAEAGPKTNFHVVAASHPSLDGAITAISSDVVDPIRGFAGDIDIEASADEPKIWLPHLSMNRNAPLSLIKRSLTGPVSVCPVLPVSQHDPMAGDRLIAAFENELSGEWEVEARNIIYAIEDDPLDLYRTITTIHRRNSSVFDALIKSHIVLSPSGNKVLAIGALMAALEQKLAVRYVEAVGYEVDWDKVAAVDCAKARIVHVWLQGEPYLSVTEAHQTVKAEGETVQ